MSKNFFYILLPILFPILSYGQKGNSPSPTDVFNNDTSKSDKLIFSFNISPKGKFKHLRLLENRGNVSDSTIQFYKKNIIHFYKKTGDENKGKKGKLTLYIPRNNI